MPAARSTGRLVPQGVIGINQDYYRTLEEDPAYTSGCIVIGDSRCCQLGIYQQRTGREDFAVYAVWGGRYADGLKPVLLTDQLMKEVEACFRAQIEAKGKCTICFFATVNDLEWENNGNSQRIAAAVEAAGAFASLSHTLDGVTYHPDVVVIGFDGGRRVGTLFGNASQGFNRYLFDFTDDLRAAAAQSRTLAGCRFVTVPEILGGRATFINDGLHYDDRALAELTAFCREAG